MSQTVNAEADGPTASVTDAGRRVASVDILRGAVMVVMALDHVRDFTSNIPFAPEDITRTYPLLFYTRWVTHFCAPLFFFLAGVGAGLQLLRGRSRGTVSRFLWTRGLWLMLLELTVIDFAWTFVEPWGFGGVIWTLGLSMVVLAAAIYLPTRWLAAVSALVIVAHDLTDGMTDGWLWTILHVRGVAQIGGLHFFVLFPLIPWVAVMGAGCAFARVWALDQATRRRWMMGLGWACIAAFLVLRGFNAYGNPPDGAWHAQPTVAMTIVSFLDVEKYPPSLQFLLMTLGPSLIVLSWLDGREAGAGGPLVVFGQVPLFFYVAHLYLIHLTTIALAALTGQPTAWLWHGGFFLNQPPEGHGYGLGVVYLVWVSVVLVLYYPCRWFARLKQKKRAWWLSYL